MDAPLKAGFAAGRRDLRGIISAETGHAEAAVLPGQQSGVFEAEIAQGVRSDQLCDLRHRVVIRDQSVCAVDVRAVEAGGDKGRGADPHVDLLCTSPAQQLHRAAAGRTADDRIVNEDHALAFDHAADRVELEVDAVSGATFSSNAIIENMRAGLRRAIEE